MRKRPILVSYRDVTTSCRFVPMLPHETPKRAITWNNGSFLTLVGPAPTLAALWCPRARFRCARLNGKQGARGVSRANLCCPRNGKRCVVRVYRGEIDPKPLRALNAWEGGFDSSSARIPAKAESRFPARRDAASRIRGALMTKAACGEAGGLPIHGTTTDVLAHAPRGMRCVCGLAACRVRAITRRR
jgi:hypothetical protein